MDTSTVLDVSVVPYIGTWIETNWAVNSAFGASVVPYIGTWIETNGLLRFATMP